MQYREKKNPQNIVNAVISTNVRLNDVRRHEGFYLVRDVAHGGLVRGPATIDESQGSTFWAPQDLFDAYELTSTPPKEASAGAEAGGIAGALGDKPESES